MKALKWQNKWSIRVRNRFAKTIVRFERENNMNRQQTALEAGKWCDANGYELISVRVSK